MNDNYIIRDMTMADYDEVFALWQNIKGLGIRSIDDSREGVERFLKRNEGISVVAVADDKIVGAILAGHDGRRGCLYHVCVAEEYRGRGIAKSMVKKVLDDIRAEGVNKVNIIAFKKNRLGNGFWTSQGWSMREDVNYYEIVLNENNVTVFVE